MLTGVVIIERSGAEEGVTDAAALRWPLVAGLPAKVQYVSSELDAFVFFAPMRSESLHHCGMSPRERMK
jgi:hypothetical protein